MRRRFISAFALSALNITAASTAGAQSIFDTSIRVAPQFYSYSIAAPASLDIYEFVTPFFVLVPITRSLTFDAGSSWTLAHAERGATGAGTKTVSEISGLTDTQLRLNYTLGTDFAVLTAGVNLPTGRSTATSDEQLAATLIGSDFFAFPVSNMGTGFGATGGVAFARSVGSWNLGAGASFRRSEAYDPFQSADGSRLRYQPGNEYRGRIGLDRPVGTGHFQLGLTYSRFADDSISGGSIYNTGDRYVTQAVLTNTIGFGDLTLAAWNLYRTAGTLASGTISGRENIANALLGYGVRAMGIRIEPSFEGRAWMQQGNSTSFLGTAALRLDANLGPIQISPSGGYSFGQLATESTPGVSATADLTGYRAVLMIRLR
jgi:hypothetical protein